MVIVVLLVLGEGGGDGQAIEQGGRSVVRWYVWVAIGLAGVYALLVVGLLLAGRRSDARAWAGFIPDC